MFHIPGTLFQVDGGVGCLSEPGEQHQHDGFGGPLEIPQRASVVVIVFDMFWHVGLLKGMVVK